MTSSPALPTPGTQLAGVETAETQGYRERQREAADCRTAPPVREVWISPDFLTSLFALKRPKQILKGV